MKFKKKRLLFVFIAVMVVVLAASAFALASNDLTVRYMNPDSSVYATNYGSLSMYETTEETISIT